VSFQRRAAAILLLLTLPACGRLGTRTDYPRTISDPARGVRYVVPAGWNATEGEARSKAGTLMTLRVYDLVEAEKKFVAGLPDTLVPQLYEWAKFYYFVDGEPVRTATTVGGLPATEFVYPIRVLKRDPPSKVIYWVVIRKTRLFVIRAAFPAKALSAEEPVMRKIVEGWGFIDNGAPTP